MRNILSLLVRTVESVNVWAGKLLAGFVLVMTGVILIEVISRYFLNKPTTWAMELATMVFGTYMVGGGAWALLKGGHVKMDIFYQRWSPRKRAIVDCLTFSLFLIFFSILLWKSTVYGLESIAAQEHSHTAWGPPIYHWKMTVPVFVALIILQGLADFLKNLVLAVTGKEL